MHEIDPFHGKRHSVPAINWLATYGALLQGVVNQLIEDEHGFRRLDSPSALTAAILGADTQQATQLAGIVRSLFTDAADEIAELEGDEDLIAELAKALDSSLLTFADRWPELSVRLTAIIGTAGKPKPILPSNQTRPLSAMDVAKYMQNPSVRDRRRAAEYVKGLVSDGLVREKIEGSNRYVYRVSDFPRESQKYVKKRT